MYICNCNGLNKEAIKSLTLTEYLDIMRCGKCAEEVFEILETLSGIFKRAKRRVRHEN